jgi:tetratricopeptide (TPR) repeat protein
MPDGTARQLKNTGKSLRTMPNSLQAHLGLGEVYVKRGSYEEAIAEMVKARPLVNLPRQLARIGYVYAAAGKKIEATKILNEVKGQTREHYNMATLIAAIYAALGDKEQAFAWLRKSCDEHQNGVKEFKVSPSFRYPALRPKVHGLAPACEARPVNSHGFNFDFG